MSGPRVPAIPRLGVNVDHVATVRNARGGVHPDPVRAALAAVEAGADGITMHLREDRRHIVDEDVRRYAAAAPAPLNLEMAATADMLAIAREVRPHACCLVPEKREERTTEGGLDAAGQQAQLRDLVRSLSEAGIRVSLFIDPESLQLQAAVALGAPVVELHTGDYCDAPSPEARAAELARLTHAAQEGAALGLEIHAGHGLSFETAPPIAALPQIAELNIGHFMMGEALFDGLPAVIRQMKRLMSEARGAMAS